MGGWLLVGQPFNDTPFDQRLLHQFRHVSGLHLAVEDALGLDDDDGSHEAKATAARFDHPYLICQSAPFYLFLKSRPHFWSTGLCAGRAATNQYVGTILLRHSSTSSS